MIAIDTTQATAFLRLAGIGEAALIRSHRLDGILEDRHRSVRGW